MPVQLSEHLAAWDRVQDALGEIRASHEECEDFFGRVLDQFAALSHGLVERRGQLFEAKRQDRDEMRGMQETAHAHLARLEAVAAELADARRDSSPESDGEATRRAQLEQMIEDARREHTRWEQERVVLETELESVRDRAAETAELLSEQKRQAAGQQEQWTGELRQMRCLLQHVAECLTAEEASEEDVRPQVRPQQEAEPVGVAADPALDSVMAQFELLQRDLAKRRATKAELDVGR